MKICILGKYPPIEGGVSTHTYWLARGLARRGHEVHVVTNADEVEDMYRMTLMPEDAPWYQGRFESSGGSVEVHNPVPFSRAAMGHIPEANPFTSKLAAVATDVIRQHACEMVLAYYYEPYGMAGWMASRWTSRPLLLKHAGSDLDRLMGAPDLATAYKEILRAADAVVTQPRLMSRFLGFGVQRDRLREDVAYGLPPEVFTPHGPGLDVDPLALDAGFGPSSRFDPGLPTFGIYGKVGASKGSFDLLAALGRLASEGLRFNFLAMVGEAQGQMLAPAVRAEGLAGRTRLLPMLPNWRVPAFLRTCTAACFLERDFPVAIHGPIIAREILACGTALVLSGEIADKQRYRDELRNGENVLVVADPRDIGALAQALRGVVTDPEGARALGARGASIAEAAGDHGRYIAQWEALLAPFASMTGTATVARKPAHPADVLDAVTQGLPDLVAYMRERLPAHLDAFLSQAEPADAHEQALAICDFVEVRLRADRGIGHAPVLVSALRYARARRRAMHAPPDDPPPFPVADALRGRAVEPQVVAALHPVRGHAVAVEEFEYDVSSLFCQATLFGQPVQSADEVDRALGGVPRCRTLVLFQRTANLAPCELQIDDATRLLVKACDGRDDTRTLVARLCRAFGLAREEDRDAASRAMLAALARLHRAGVIVFGERQAWGGWTGGSRGRTPLAAA